MTIDLIQGQFAAEEAISLITKLIEMKIKFHEEKISQSDTEEDIKMRENRIKSLQNSLADSRALLKTKNSTVSIQSEINFN